MEFRETGIFEEISGANVIYTSLRNRDEFLEYSYLRYLEVYWNYSDAHNFITASKHFSEMKTVWEIWKRQKLGYLGYPKNALLQSNLRVEILIVANT